MEGDSSIDLDPLIEASSEFASYPGTLLNLVTLFLLLCFNCLDIFLCSWIVGMQTEDSVREFLERFPLTLLFRFIGFLSFNQAFTGWCNFILLILETKV